MPRIGRSGDSPVSDGACSGLAVKSERTWSGWLVTTGPPGQRGAHAEDLADAAAGAEDVLDLALVEAQHLRARGAAARSAASASAAASAGSIGPAGEAGASPTRPGKAGSSVLRGTLGDACSPRTLSQRSVSTLSRATRREVRSVTLYSHRMHARQAHEDHRHGRPGELGPATSWRA